MKTTRQFLLVFAASVVMGVSSHAQTPKRVVVRPVPATAPNADAPQYNCAGIVTDSAGQPLAGATVEYWRYEGNPALSNGLESKEQVTTETNGAFKFSVSRSAGFLLARKPGLAPAWKQLGQPFGPAQESQDSLKLVLTPPTTLSGMVVDEADKPVANAEVFAAVLGSGIPGEE